MKCALAEPMESPHEIGLFPSASCHWVSVPFCLPVSLFPPPTPPCPLTAVVLNSIDHLERIVEIARLRAVQRKARFAKLKVCVFKEEMPITPYECPLLNSLRFERSESDGQLFEHHCEVDVSFGPWEAVADVYDLLHCLVTDLSAQGLTVDHQCIGVCDKHLVNHYYCKRPIYEFKITWW